MKTDPDQIVLSDQQRRQIAIAADATGKQWPAVLESALESLPKVNGVDPVIDSDRPISILDRLRKIGFVGAQKGGPTDLSTNPQYMEGFGRD
jgi:hypothetical protein